MAKKKLATFTPEEGKFWVDALNYHLEDGLSNDEADHLAWQETVVAFPRLKKFDGAKP